MPLLRSQAISPLLLALVCVLPAEAQQAMPFRSATHPFSVMPPDRQSWVRDWTFSGDLTLTATDGSTAWYSANVNRVLCSLLLNDETWLGTAFGVKRLNLRAHTTRHYTSLDGLPHSYITALASDGKTIFCASVGPSVTAKANGARVANSGFQSGSPQDTAAALCRFDAGTARWSVIAEAKREEPASLPPEDSENMSVPKQWVSVNADYACLVAGPCMPGKAVALAVRLKDKATERIPAPDGVKQPLTITTALLDARSLWLGTRQGVFRYDLQTRAWETLLPDAAVFGGVRDPDGSVWILTRTADAYQTEGEQRGTRLVHWSAVHFMLGKPLHAYPVRERRDSKNEWAPAWMENITLAEGKVWMTEQRHITIRFSPRIDLPDVYSLDPQTGRVELEASTSDPKNNDYARLPASTLANAHSGLALTPLLMPTRFPGWKCDADAKETDLLAPQRDQPDTRDAQGRLWEFASIGGSRRNGKFLERKGVGDRSSEKDEDYHALPPKKFLVYDEAAYPSVVDGKIYFLTGTYIPRLCAWDRETNRVEAVEWADAALKAHPGDGWERYKMLPGKNCVWISTGNGLMRCELNTRNVTFWRDPMQGARSYAPCFALIGVEGDTAWIADAPNHLLRASSSDMQAMTPVPLPPFPGDMERVRNNMALCALEDHIAWFEGQPSSGLAPRSLIGYNLQTRQWTKSLEAALPYTNPGEVLAVRKQGAICWFPASSNSASLYGYDSEQAQWITLPPITGSMNGTLQIAAVDAQSAWLTDSDHLYHLDRTQAKWDKNPLPFALPLFAGKGSTRLDNSLYFATPTGVWAYDTLTKEVRQSPGVAVPSEEMNYRAMSVDAKAVWLIAEKSRTYYACRFDRISGAWKYWFTADGLPPEYGSLIGDGQSCWALSGGQAYHLDPQTDRWDNISRQLAALTNAGESNGKIVPVQQILADGPDVWLVPGVPLTPYRASALPADAPVAVSAPLYRYRADTGQITPVDPAPGKTLATRWLTASARSLLLSAEQGVYRMDRASGKWQPVLLPPLPAGFPTFTPYVAREVPDGNGANLWVLSMEDARFGVGEALRFRLMGQ